MNVIIFSGPTLAVRDARPALEAEYLPPASQGDVYRVARRRPDAIGIIDGYFDRLPAVWHKEILWAMSQGVHVYGSASMGALRAAELSPFGMVGIGWVFEAFRDGLLEDDDEVTVAHAAGNLDYRPHSEAMVNIRRTLAAASSDGIITQPTHDLLITTAKGMYYPERDYPALLGCAAELGLPAVEIDRLRAWLPAGRVNQKRDDALAMLRAIRHHLEHDRSPKAVAFTFEHTVWWDRATSHAGVSSAPSSSTDSGSMLLMDSLLEELRLTPGLYRRTHNGAALEVLLMREAARARIGATPHAVSQTAAAFRAAFGLVTSDELERWLAANDLTLERFSELMSEETLCDRARVSIDTEVIARLPDHLRTTGHYAGLADRAREKARILAAQGVENASLEEAGLTEDELLRWYYARSGDAVPVDLTRAAHEAGFDCADALRLALIRERCFLAVTGPDRPRQMGATPPPAGDA